MTDQVDDFLAHHGILGMHWGVRHDKPTNPRQQKNESHGFHRDHQLSPAERNALIAGGAAIVTGAVITGVILGRRHIAMTELKNELAHTVQMGSNFNVDKDMVLPKDTNLFRVAGQLETGIDAPKYATYTPRDALYYRQGWTPVTFGDHKERSFRTLFSTKSPIKIASEDTMDSLAEELFKGTDEQSMKFKSLAKNFMNVSDKASPETLAGIFNSRSATTNFKDPAQKAFLDYVKSKGYSGITDINNTGNLAQHAVVLFDNEVINTTGKPLTNLERKTARRAFNNLDHALKFIRKN